MNEFDNQRFDNGASYLVSDEAYNAYIEGRASLGRPDSENGNLFCSPKEEIDRAINNSKGDLSKLESELGLDKGTLGDGPIHRVDIVNPSDHNLREVTGRESGANCFFNTPRDENEKLPDIKFVTETDGKDVWTKRDSEGREIINVDKTKPEELAKLNGRYATTDGSVHEANLEGYKHTTSGGLYEGVINQVPNTPQHVQHLTIDGWKRGVSSDDLQTRVNHQAYYKTSGIINSQVTPEQIQKMNGSNGPNITGVTTRNDMLKEIPANINPANATGGNIRSNMQKEMPANIDPGKMIDCSKEDGTKYSMPPNIDPANVPNGTTRNSMQKEMPADIDPGKMTEYSKENDMKRSLPANIDPAQMTNHTDSMFNKNTPLSSGQAASSGGMGI